MVALKSVPFVSPSTCSLPGWCLVILLSFMQTFLSLLGHTEFHPEVKTSLQNGENHQESLIEKKIYLSTSAIHT